MRQQAERCRRANSMFYAHLLDQCSVDVANGGACWRPFLGQSFAAALPLRFMAGVHRLVLDGQCSDLARHYPSVGGDGDAEAAWSHFVDAVSRHPVPVASHLERAVQTNEVGRCRALLGGFLLVAEQTALPIRLLELGASAGLNLRWDRYAYSCGSRNWGYEGSPVRLEGGFLNDPPFREVPVEVAERKGCDLAPIDPLTESGERTLLSYTWADNLARLQTLAGAIAIASSVPAEVERANALEWLPVQLKEPSEGLSTVVFHSYVLQLLNGRGRAQLKRIMETAGLRATPQSPLSWLQYEFTEGKGTVGLTTWPGGDKRILAVASAHGENIEWRGADRAAVACVRE
jgi:hypothetical protein